MEVFIAYQDGEEAMLGLTANAWLQCEEAIICPIKVDDKLHKAEIIRRICADNVAESNFYMLADLGCVPESADVVRCVLAKLADESNRAGLIGLFSSYGEAGEIPHGVRICRKGAVKQWVQKRTVTYDEEHAESVRNAGEKVEIWRDIAFKHVLAC